MSAEAKDRDPYGLSRLEAGEEFGGNHPIERVRPRGEIDRSGVNFKAQEMRKSGKYEYVRTDSAFNGEGGRVLGERAIFFKKKGS